MKKIALLLAISLIVTGAVAAKVMLPQATRFQLDNGLSVVVVERHTLPLFSIGVIFRAGSIYDEPSREGLATVCNDLPLRGTATHSAKEITDQVSFGGGQLQNYCDREDAGFVGEFMSAYGESCFEILGDVILNSVFLEDEFEKARQQAQAYLAGILEDPRAAADDFIFSQVLGGTPYAHSPLGTTTGLDSVTRDEAFSFFKRYYTPDNCLIVVCGDVTSDIVRTWLIKYLGQWQGKADRTPIGQNPPPAKGPTVLLLNKEDATQAQIRLGGLCPAKGNSDYVPFEAAKTVFGGSFTSRLTNEIRINRGLSYTARCEASYFSAGGVAYVNTFTRYETVSEAIDVILAESRRMQTELVPDSELAGAIKYQSGLYPLDFETNDDIVSVFVSMWLYDLEASSFEDFQEKLKTVESRQVMDQARKYFPSQNFHLVVVGRADSLEAPLRKYGQVTIKDLIAP